MPSRKRIDGVSSRVWLIHARGGALPSKGNTIWYVLFYGVVSAQTERVVEFFLERDAAKKIGLKTDVPFMCECASIDCHGQVEVTTREWEAVAARPNHFLMIAGHQRSEGEQVVGSLRKYDIARKPE